MPTPNAKRAKGRAVQVVAVDPGSTSGVVVVSVATSWLRGLGDPTWEGLGGALGVRLAYQLGRDPRVYGEAPVDRRRALDEYVLPILADQPLVDPEADLRTRSGVRFYRIMDGTGPAGGGSLNVVDAGEVIQVRQLNGLLANYPRAALVIEDFSLRTEVRSREVTSPDRLRLAITAHECIHGPGRVPFLQQPSMAKTTATDDRLKRAGLYFPGLPHATDAARHALTFVRNARQNESLRAAAWPRYFKDEFDA